MKKILTFSSNFTEYGSRQTFGKFDLFQIHLTLSVMKNNSTLLFCLTFDV